MVCQKCTLVIYGCGEVSWTQGKTVTTQQLSGKKAFLYCYYMVLWCCIGGGGSVFPAREAPTALLRLLWDGSSEFRIGDGVWLSAFWGGSMEYYFLCSEIVVVVEKKERVPSIWATRNLFIWAVESFNNFKILVAKASWGGLGIVLKDL